MEEVSILYISFLRLLCCLQNDFLNYSLIKSTMDALIPTAYSYRAFLSIKMLVLRLLVAVLFHLPVVLSYPHYPTHLVLRDGSLSTDPPLPTTTAPSIPTSLPLPSTTPIPNPTTTGDPWTDMCKPGAECDCSRIADKNGEEYV